MARQRITRAEINIVEWDRATFFEKVWDYQDGDHATFLAPTGGGKTQIALEALRHSATPERQGWVFMMKPKDATIERFARTAGFETIRDYPPPSGGAVKARLGISKKPPGYILQPRETGDPDLDDVRQEVIFRRALRGLYVSAKKNPNIEFVDETYSLEHELHLSKDIVRAETKGRSIGNGCWCASQRAAYINHWCYQAQHLFLGFDPDKKAQDRLGEIGGGFDPDVVRDMVAGLKIWEFLYINREERAMCIIGAD